MSEENSLNYDYLINRLLADIHSYTGPIEDNTFEDSVMKSAPIFYAMLSEARDKGINMPRERYVLLCHKLVLTNTVYAFLNYSHFENEQYFLDSLLKMEQMSTPFVQTEAHEKLVEVLWRAKETFKKNKFTPEDAKNYITKLLSIHYKNEGDIESALYTTIDAVDYVHHEIEPKMHESILVEKDLHNLDYLLKALLSDIESYTGVVEVSDMNNHVIEFPTTEESILESSAVFYVMLKYETEMDTETYKLRCHKFILTNLVNALLRYTYDNDKNTMVRALDKMVTISKSFAKTDEALMLWGVIVDLSLAVAVRGYTVEEINQYMTEVLAEHYKNDLDLSKVNYPRLKL